jgi:GT2 family glycosyltransferase
MVDLFTLMPQPLVSVVIVSYNSAADLPGCLESVLTGSAHSLEVIVADNASRDGSLDLVRKQFPTVSALNFGENLGFAAANNRVFARTQTPYILMLNPDTVIAPGGIDAMVEALQQDQSVGIVQAKMLIHDEPRLINSAGIKVNKSMCACDRGSYELDEGQYDQIPDIPAACGGALMLRREVLEQVGDLDTTYFMYYEDFDLGLRARIGGWQVNLVPQARVYHKLKTIRAIANSDYLDHRHRIYTMLKDMGADTLRWMLPRALRFDISEIRRMQKGGAVRPAQMRRRAWYWNLAHLPGTLRKRHVVQARRKTPDRNIIALFDDYFGYPRMPVPVPDYEPRTLARLTAAGKTLAGEFTTVAGDEAHLGYGWYPRRQYEGRLSRRTGKYAIAFVGAPAGGGQLLVDYFTAQDGTVWIAVGDNDAPEREYAVLGGAWQTLHVPVSAPGPNLRIWARTELPEGLMISGMKFLSP